MDGAWGRYGGSPHRGLSARAFPAFPGTGMRR